MRALPTVALVTALASGMAGGPATARAAAPNEAADSDAATHAQAEAGRQFDAGDYRGAAESLERAYALDPSSRIYSARASLASGGDCEAALPSLKRSSASPR